MMRLLKLLGLPLAAVLFLLLAIAWMAGLFNDSIRPGLAPEVDTVTDDTVAVLRLIQPRSEAVAGTLIAKEATMISSRIMARITQVPVRSGDSVEAGDTLIELEREDVRSRRQQAEQSIRAVTARLEEARIHLQRVASLREQGLVAVADVDRARADVQALTADQAVARQRLEEAEVMLSYTRIRAPIAGRIVDRFAEPGDMASPGVPLLSLYNPVSLRVEAPVRESLAVTLNNGDALRVEIPAVSQTATAVIEEVVPAADPASRSFTVKAALPYNSRLLPGMYARVQVPAGEQVVLLVPEERIARIGQLDMLWVDTGGGVEARYIRTGATLAHSGARWTIVISGVTEGEAVLPVLH